ncbi:MAG TPA: H(+)/Cl(-) exchange transporter ClcA [Opitutaceae bacterium]|nr:H(+)/Cl(-) exchange transporter ClcA [Opitutaceae bacterium]
MRDSAEPTFGMLNKQDVKRRHILIKALLVGVAAGAVGSGFRGALLHVETLRLRALDSLSPTTAVGASVAIGAVLGALAVWLVARFCPEASGSGIPHLKSVLLGENEFRWRRLLPVKFLAGVAAIGGGMALGREGPTIQMGGACGLGVAKTFKVKRGEGERKALISAGAGAGLAAAFNAPLAGVVFVVEELQGNFTPVVFVAAFLASVAADVIARVSLGGFPVIELHHVIAPGNSVLPAAAVLGLLAGLGGIAFNRCLLGGLDLRARLPRVPSWLVGAIVGAAIGLVGGYFPRVVGSGNGLIELAVTGQLVTHTLLLVLITRFALTMVSYASGAAGGIFAPLLVLGSIGGLGFGQAAHLVMPAWIPHPEVFAVLGMGALFTAIVRAPLTGIVLMVEMTGEYAFMLPLLVSCLIAYGVAEAVGSKPIYDALRERSRHATLTTPQADTAGAN